VFEETALYDPTPAPAEPASAIIPNSAQQDALLNLEELRGQGVGKAAIIAATGVGKTYLFAFDFKNK
jgi:superfamily II DNA or RNA helicase